MRLANFLPSLLLCATATNAWPTLWNPLDIAKRDIIPALDRRADQPNAAQSSSSAVSRKKTTVAGSSSTVVVTSTGNRKGGTTTQTGKGTTTGSNKKGTTTSKYETTKSFSDVLPAGGVSMITPAAILGPQYYKIGNPSVTEIIPFVWNFTSLSVTPSAVDVLASCSLNSVTYTLALNQSITGPTQTLLWDTGEYERTASVPLAVATYALIVYDSASSPDAIARAGYLGTFNQLTFGMYLPAPAIEEKTIKCVTCGAASSLDRHTMAFLLGLVGVTLLSFGWFGGVAGLW